MNKYLLPNKTTTILLNGLLSNENLIQIINSYHNYCKDVNMDHLNANRQNENEITIHFTTYSTYSNFTINKSVSLNFNNMEMLVKNLIYLGYL